MSSNVPWKELAFVGATTLGVCCMIGWLTGAENLQKKKKPQARGPPGAVPPEMQEFDALIGLAEAAMKKGAFTEVERAYLRVLEIAAGSEDPQFQIIPHYIHRRLTEVYEKMANWDQCFKYLSICLDHLMKKQDASQDDLHTLMVLAERSVDLSMPHGTPEQQEKFLGIWLEIATKFQATEAIVMASLLLGKLKFNQDKLVEAESFLRRAVTVYTDPNQREELWLNTKTAHLECLTRLESHEAAKKCVREIADFLINTSAARGPNKGLATLANMAPELLASTGERCIFLGYMEEAEYILKSTLSLMKKRGTPMTEIAQVDHSIATVWSATGRLPQAREKIKEMKSYLRAGMGSSIFPMHSKYLQTQSVKHDTEGSTVTVYRGKDPTRTLKPESVLVVNFENPEETGEPLPTVEHVIQASDESIRVLAPVNYSNYIGQIFSAEITIYNAAKSEVLGTHFVFIPSTIPTATSSSAPFSFSSLSSSGSAAVAPPSSSNFSFESSSNSSPISPNSENAAILEQLIAAGRLPDDGQSEFRDKVITDLEDANL